MAEPRALSAEQREILRQELARDDLAIYTVVLMAQKDVAVGHFDTAIARLRVDADKLRMHSAKLCELIAYQYQN